MNLAIFRLLFSMIACVFVSQVALSETFEPITTLHNNGFAVMSLAFSPDSTKLAAGGVDKTVTIREVPSWRCVDEINGLYGGMVALQFTSDGKILLTGSGEDAIRLWNTKNWNCTQSFAGGHGSLYSAAIDPAGKVIASSGAKGTIELWDTATLKHFKRFNDISVNRLAFSPDSRILASVDGEGEITLWDVASGKASTTIRQGPCLYSILAFSPDGKTLVSDFSANETFLVFWDVTTGKRIATLPRSQHGMIPFSAAFSPDGEFLAVGLTDTDDHSFDANVLILDVTGLYEARNIPSLYQIKNRDTGKNMTLAILHGHTKQIEAIAFGSNGKWLASGGYDHTIKIWDMNAIRKSIKRREPAALEKRDH